MLKSKHIIMNLPVCALLLLVVSAAAEYHYPSFLLPFLKVAFHDGFSPDQLPTSLALETLHLSESAVPGSIEQEFRRTFNFARATTHPQSCCKEEQLTSMGALLFAWKMKENFFLCLQKQPMKHRTNEQTNKQTNNMRTKNAFVVGPKPHHHH